MRIELSGVAKGRALPETTVAFASGRATLAVAETEQRPTVLGLIASGRMVPSSGSVELDGRKDAAALRRRVALVDAPDVSDPAPNVALAGVVAEELMFAGLRSDPLAARRWLHDHGVRGLSRVPIADIAPSVRLRLLLELAALRPGVEGIVLVAPDRHGGDPREWWGLAEEFAARGFAVLVVAGEAAASVLSSASGAGPTARGAARMPRPSRVRPRVGRRHVSTARPRARAGAR